MGGEPFFNLVEKNLNDIYMKELLQPFPILRKEAQEQRANALEEYSLPSLENHQETGMGKQYKKTP